MANIHKHYPPSPQIPHVRLIKKCIGIHYVLAECRIWKKCSLAYWMYEVHNKSTDDNGGGGGGGSGIGDNGGGEKKKMTMIMMVIADGDDNGGGGDGRR